MSRAEQIMEFIKKHTDAGKTVYASTYTHIIPIKAKHIRDGLVFIRNDHVEVQRGKKSVSINYCKFTAR